MLLDIGKVDKAHGLRGDVIVTLSTNVVERVAPGSVLDANGRALRVVRSAPHQHRYIVTFEGVTTKEQADDLHGVTLRAEPIEDDDDPDTLWVHRLIGRRVMDQHGTDLGSVVAVIDNPASDLLEVESGVLIPLRFVTDHADPAALHVDLPDGLLDLDAD